MHASTSGARGVCVISHYPDRECEIIKKVVSTKFKGIDPNSGNLLTVEGEAVLFAWFCFTSSYVNLQQVIFLPKALFPD